MECFDFVSKVFDTLAPRDALAFLGCCRKLATVAPRAAVLFACTRPPISTTSTSDLSVEHWKEVWRQACAQGIQPSMWAFSESASFTVRHPETPEQEEECYYWDQHGRFLCSFANVLRGDLQLSAILMAHAYETADYTSSPDGIWQWDSVALAMTSDMRFVVLDAHLELDDVAGSSLFVGGEVHVADTMVEAVGSCQWRINEWVGVTGKVHRTLSLEPASWYDEWDGVPMGSESIYWTPWIPRLTAQQARVQQAWRSSAAQLFERVLSC